MTTPPQPPSEMPTPRTDSIRDKLNAVETRNGNWYAQQVIDFTRQLEKELQEAKEDSQVLNNYHNNPAWLKHYIKGRDYSFPEFVDNLIIECDNLTTELALLKRANGEMREALIDLISQIGHKTISLLKALKALSTTPAPQPSPSIPMDVAEKMYEALQFLITQVHTKHEADSGYTICPVCIALTAAEKHGLGKRKYNLK